jgi:predicted dehydrogenase
MSLKVVLIGCGKIADGHIEEIQKMPAKATMVAVCDLELLMAEQAATRYGIPQYYDQFDRMLEREKPDVVHIATPPQSHLALTKMAMEAGCHVYVEKPLTLRHCDSVELIALAEHNRRKVTIGYTYLFDPPAEAMRALIKQGTIGDVVHVESFYGYNLSGPFGAAILGDGSHWVHRLPGKLFQNNIDHLLYKITEFLDDEKPCIHAIGSVRRQHRFQDSRDDLQDELRILIQGHAVTAYGTFSSHIRPAGNFARVYGTKNTLHVDYINRTVTVDASPRLPSALGRLLPAFQQGWQYVREGGRNVRRFVGADYHFFAGLNRLISLFYDSILNDTPPPISYSEMLRISAMMEEIVRQTDQGTPAR